MQFKPGRVHVLLLLLALPMAMTWQIFGHQKDYHLKDYYGEWSGTDWWKEKAKQTWNAGKKTAGNFGGGGGEGGGGQPYYPPLPPPTLKLGLKLVF